MATHNAENERIKRRYFSYLKEARRHSESTVDSVAKALNRFESHTRHRDFKAFQFGQAVAFKKHLAEERSLRANEKLSKATLHATLTHLKAFFQWLAGQPGYKSRLVYSDADYFNISDNDVRIATTRREKASPTIEQVKHVIATMPAQTEIERRDQALVAFTLLTGARDSATASLKIKHIDLVANSVCQDAREVRTKFRKTFTTYFFPVGGEIRAIIVDWLTYLREARLWGNNDPIFPATQVALLPTTRQFATVGLRRDHWKSAAPIRIIFRDAFARAGLPYFNPHSLRATLVQLGQVVCQTPEAFKAWSQNLGHEDVLTTFLSYGQVASCRQRDIMRDLANPQAPSRPSVVQLARVIVQQMRDEERESVTGTTSTSEILSN